jgi:hypothetical protein
MKGYPFKNIYILHVKGHSSDIRSIRFKHTCIICFFGFFKKYAQNTQSGKGYANNHYRAAKTAVC